MTENLTTIEKEACMHSEDHYRQLYYFITLQIHSISFDYRHPPHISTFKNTISLLGSREEKKNSSCFTVAAFCELVLNVHVFLFNIKRWEISGNSPFEFLFIQFICYYIRAIMEMEINLTKKKS